MLLAGRHVLGGDEPEPGSEPGSGDQDALAVGEGHGPDRPLGRVGIDFDQLGPLVHRKRAQDLGGLFGPLEVGDAPFDGKGKAGGFRLVQPPVGRRAGLLLCQRRRLARHASTGLLEILASHAPCHDPWGKRF